MTEDKGALPELRASHMDRDRIAEQLRVAAGDGRLTMEELDERLEKALSARTGSELAVLVTDLPAVATGSVLDVPPTPKELMRIDVSSGHAVREGRWVVPRAMEVKAGSGSVKLDLTQAVLTGSTLILDVTVRSGSLTIITKPGIEVVMEDVSVSSGSATVRHPGDAGSVPTVLRVEVSGSVRSGSIVARPPRAPRRGFFAWLLRRPRRAIEY